MRFSSLFPFVLGAALIPHTHAWGAVGHEVVATLAQMHLHPSVMPKLCAILGHAGDCHLAPVAAWADRARRQGRYRWTGPLHYIGAEDDYPSSTCVFPGPNGWNGRTHINVLSAIRNTTNVLQEFEAFHGTDDQMEYIPSYVQDALKFLIHFVGDMHQPLHLTGRDRGGNEDKVAFDGRTTSLHSVWDSLLISERLRTLPYNYTFPLPLPDVESHLRDTIYDPYIRRLIWEGLLGKWENELDAWLACPSASATSHQHQRQLAPPPSIWQYILALLSSPSAATGDGGLGVDDDTVCPYAWAKPIHQLNCHIVFPPALDSRYDDALYDRLASLSRLLSSRALGHDHASGDDNDDDDDSDAFMLRKSKKSYLELYTPEYAGVIKEEWIVEKLLTQAGIRLAAVLNSIFAEPGEGEVSRRYLTTL